jgi:membrane-associated protein
MVERLVELAGSIPAIWVVVAVFLLSACETAFVLGFVLPGELTVFLGGAAAAGGNVPLAVVCVAATFGPITGDTIGYFVGRRRGKALLKKRFPKKWPRVESLLKRRGRVTVFLGRFVPVFRTMIPLAAGAARMPLREFALAAVPAALVWGSGSSLLGFAAVRSFSGGGLLAHLSWGIAALAIAILFFFAHRILSKSPS